MVDKQGSTHVIFWRHDLLMLDDYCCWLKRMSKLDCKKSISLSKKNQHFYLKDKSLFSLNSAQSKALRQHVQQNGKRNVQWIWITTRQHG